MDRFKCPSDSCAPSATPCFNPDQYSCMAAGANGKCAATLLTCQRYSTSDIGVVCEGAGSR